VTNRRNASEELKMLPATIDDDDDDDEVDRAGD
jgi:hypothetical protein